MNLRSKSILLVDDNTRIRKALRDLFEGAGFACAEAANGAQALELAELLLPDLIVLDFSMPGMNGLEAAPLFKQKLPQTPIVMFTMFANEAFAKVAIATGVTEVISKDQAGSQLLPRVGFLLGCRAG